MTYEEALEQLRDHPHYQRYVVLCGPDSPSEWHRQSYRLLVIEKASGSSPIDELQRLDAAYASAGTTPKKGCCGH